MWRGLTNAGIKLERVHPDVQPVGKNKKPVLVRLNPDRAFDKVELLPGEFASPLWTLRNGKHNSFPFVSLPPLLDLPTCEREAFNKRWENAGPDDRRKALHHAAERYPSGGQQWDRWPGNGLLKSLRSKRAVLDRIESDAAAVPKVIDRFLAILQGTEPRRAFVDALASAIPSRS